MSLLNIKDMINKNKKSISISPILTYMDDNIHRNSVSSNSSTNNNIHRNSVSSNSSSNSSTRKSFNPYFKRFSSSNDNDNDNSDFEYY